MRDEYGRINNRAQVIRSLDKLRLAHLLSLIATGKSFYFILENTRLIWYDKCNCLNGN